MKIRPLITVVIPTYNRPELVLKAVQSVLSQTYQDFEIIVVDDGENKVRGVVEGHDDSRVRYIEHERNKGCSAAKNTGVKHAKGMHIAFLDDDDMWLPQKLELQLAALKEAPPDVGFAFTGSYELFDDREYISHVPEGVGDYHELALQNFSTMIDSSMLYKKEVFEKVGGLDENFPTHTGAEYIIRVSKEFLGIGIDTPLVIRLITRGHVHMGSNLTNRIKGREMLLAKYKEEFARRPRFLAKHLTLLAKWYRGEREYQKAQALFQRALALQFQFVRLLHVLSMYGNGLGYRLFRKLKMR